MNLNFVLNFFMKAVMNTLLSFVAALSIIVHIFIINLAYPLELTNFFSQIFKLVTFDVVPYIDEIYDYLFGFDRVDD
jgi:hypothetical protein